MRRVMPSLVALLIATPTYAQMSAQPAILEIAAGDSSGVGVINLTNQGDAPLQVSLSQGDFEQRADGSHSLTALGTHRSSCNGRITVFPEQLTLLPGESRPVQVRMSEGNDLCWSAVYATVDAPQGSTFQMRQEIAIKTYGLPSGLTRDGKITSVEANATEVGLDVALTFENRGTAPLRPAGRLEVRRPTGEIVATADVASFSALPGHVRNVTAHLDRPLPAGEYVAVPILDIGAAHLVGGQGSFSVR